MTDADTMEVDLEAGQAGHRNMHEHAHRKLNALRVLTDPSATASENVTRIAAAIAAVTDASGNMGTVTLGPGEWLLNGAVGIELRGKYGGVLQGVGEATRLIWAGNADGTIIKVAHCQRMLIRDLYIGANNAALIGIHITRDNTPSSHPAPTKTNIEHVYIDGRVNGVAALTDAIRIMGVDANNDFNVFRSVHVEGYTAAGWRLVGSQSYGNEMEDCHAFGPAPYGVRTQDGANAATFSWRGGSMYGHSIADFYVTRNFYYPTRIEGVNSEGSECFLIANADNGNGLGRTIVIDGVRWSGAESVNHVAMQIEGLVHATVENSHFGDGSDPTPANVIQYSPSPQSHFTFKRNCIYSSAVNVFSDSVPEDVAGNWQYTNEAGGGELITPS
jgi:hypothetical protein